MVAVATSGPMDTHPAHPVPGPEELVERCDSLLSALGSALRIGPVGVGTEAKLIANTTLVGVVRARASASTARRPTDYSSALDGVALR